jgi:hypothetical protein
MPESIEEQRNGLLKEVEDIIDSSASSAKRNRLVAFWIVTLTIVSSFAATILSALEIVDAKTIALVSGIPGALAVANSLLKFEEHSIWFYERVNALKTIRTKLRYPGTQLPDVVALGAELDAVRKEMHEKRSRELRVASHTKGGGLTNAG